MSLVHEAIK